MEKGKGFEITLEFHVKELASATSARRPFTDPTNDLLHGSKLLSKQPAFCYIIVIYCSLAPSSFTLLVH